jgi:hypothetical protein
MECGTTAENNAYVRYIGSALQVVAINGLGATWNFISVPNEAEQYTYIRYTGNDSYPAFDVSLSLSRSLALFLALSFSLSLSLYLIVRVK